MVSNPTLCVWEVLGVNFSSGIDFNETKYKFAVEYKICSKHYSERETLQFHCSSSDIDDRYHLYYRNFFLWLCKKCPIHLTHLKHSFCGLGIVYINIATTFLPMSYVFYI